MGFWYRICHTASRIFAKVVNSYRVENREGLSTVEGGLIIASNHVSFLDPPLIGVAFREPIYYFARRTLFDHPAANFILTRIRALPVDQQKPELSILKKIIQLLRDDEKVLIFPEGERSWDGKLKMEGQPGVGMIVAKSQSACASRSTFRSGKISSERREKSEASSGDSRRRRADRFFGIAGRQVHWFEREIPAHCQPDHGKHCRTGYVGEPWRVSYCALRAEGTIIGD